MNGERWSQLNRDGRGLTPEEFAQGWHYCIEWDFLLVGPGMVERDACMCFKSHKNDEVQAR